MQPAASASLKGAASTAPVSAPTVLYPTVQEKLAAVDVLLVAYRAIAESNDPKKQVEVKQEKLAHLQIAYQTCIEAIQALKGATVPPEVAERLWHVLGEDARLNYNYNGAAHPYKVSKELNLGALQALLYQTRLSSQCPDFTSPALSDLFVLRQNIISQTPFAGAAAEFCGHTTNNAFQKVCDQNFSAEEIIIISKNLRYLSGAIRYIRLGEDRSEMNAGEKQITQKLLELALQLLDHKIANEKDPFRVKALEKERYEVNYNDGTDLLRAKDQFNLEELKKLRDWVFRNAPKASFVAARRKFILPGEDRLPAYRQTLHIALERIQPFLAPSSFQTLQAIIAGKIIDEDSIKTLIPEFFKVGKPDETKGIDVAWFAMIPCDVAEELLKLQNPANDAEVLGLLRLSLAITEAYNASQSDLNTSIQTEAKNLLAKVNTLNVDGKLATQNTQAMMQSLTQIQIALNSFSDGQPDQNTPEENLLILLPRISTLAEPELSEKISWLKTQDIAGLMIKAREAQELSRQSLALLEQHEQTKPAAQAIRPISKNISALENRIELMLKVQQALEKRKAELAK